MNSTGHAGRMFWIKIGNTKKNALKEGDKHAMAHS
jgi:hypothetical protein